MQLEMIDSLERGKTRLQEEAGEIAKLQTRTEKLKGEL